ncbi:TPR end-of-group domain-containing protein [Shewanella sp. YIC-542]|uniref:TPR end-of-group domain-containing protein n=1 Tax=Shewanella mytili TaxID=3377111 RepID=UPI00398EC8DB
MRLALLLLLLLIPWQGMAAEAPSSYAKQSLYDKPLMERYVLDELKSLRQDQQSLEQRVIRQITDRELAVADKSMNYANVTVTYFFYLIAAAASLIALVGWQSLRDIRVNTQRMANQKLDDIAERYEKKFQEMERELKRKSRIISENNKEIERINEIHNLWIRAQHSPTPEQKIDIYNEILKIRPGDLEALTYMADAAMEMDEYHWALSICNRVLEVDPQNANALYQRACAYSRLGAEDQAISDLTLAIEHSASLSEAAKDEKDFATLHGDSRFDKIIADEAK